VDSVKVLGEASRGDEVVDLAVLFRHFDDGLLHRLRVYGISIVRSDSGKLEKRRLVALLTCLHGYIG
jgi:hypothetical protein